MTRGVVRCCVVRGVILALLVLCPHSSMGQSVDLTCTVTNVAGDGVGLSPGWVDGQGSAARFSSPIGLAINMRTGDLYSTDYGVTNPPGGDPPTVGCAVRITTPEGLVRTLAGGASPCGHVDGVGTAAAFKSPAGIALFGTATAGGTLVYVADALGNAVRVVTAGGVVSTLAGGGSSENVNGVGTNAQFNFPFGVAVGATGTVYVADFLNGEVRTITPAGSVSAFVGSSTTLGTTKDGTGTNAHLTGPLGLAMSGTTLLVVSYDNTLRRVTTPGGVVTTLAGGPMLPAPAIPELGHVDGRGTAARFNSPYGVAVNASGWYVVADTMNSVVRLVTPVTNAAVTLSGSSTSDPVYYGEGTGTSALYNGPTGVAVDGNGMIYIIDNGNNLLRRLVCLNAVPAFPTRSLFPTPTPTRAFSTPLALVNIATQPPSPTATPVATTCSTATRSRSNTACRSSSPSRCAITTTTNSPCGTRSRSQCGSASPTPSPSACGTPARTPSACVPSSQGRSRTMSVSPTVTVTFCPAPPGFYCAGGAVLVCPVGAYCAGGGAGSVACFPTTACTVAGLASQPPCYWDYSVLVGGFSDPFGLVSESPTTLLVADQFNHVIKRVNLQTLAVTNVVGNGAASSTDGAGVTATTSGPVGSFSP